MLKTYDIDEIKEQLLNEEFLKLHGVAWGISDLILQEENHTIRFDQRFTTQTDDKLQTTGQVIIYEQNENEEFTAIYAFYIVYEYPLNNDEYTRAKIIEVEE